MKLSVNIPTTPMDVVPLLGNVLSGGGRALRADSLIDYSQPTRIEPVTLVEQSLWREPYMEDILQSALNIFTGYYMQAVALSAEIKGISVVKRLEPFNPKRDPMNSVFDSLSSMVATEDGTRFGLPSLENMRQLNTCNSLGAINWSRPSNEAARVNGGSNPMGNDGAEGSVSGKPALVSKSGATIETVSKETLQSLRDNSNLSVGKMVEVAVVVDDKSVKVPVNIRLQTMPVPSRSMTLYLTAGAQNRSFKERWYDFKAEKLHFFSDLIGINDLLDEHRRNIIKDTSGLYLKQMQQKRKNTLAGFLSGKPSVANASNIVVITEEQRVTIERTLNIKLSTLRGRRVLEENSSIMLLIVVDRQYEQVEIYHRGIEGVSELSISSVKNASKSTGPDIMKVMEAYKSMKAPTF